MVAYLEEATRMALTFCGRTRIWEKRILMSRLDRTALARYRSQAAALEFLKASEDDISA